MATSIGVQESTRDRLERLKREVGEPSLDSAISVLLREHEQLKAHKASAQLLRSLAEKRSELVRFARRHGIRSIALFGSALHGEVRPGSDLDLLVTFEHAKTPGLIALSAMQRQLSTLLEVPVDLQTPGSLSRHIREAVLAEALEIYVAT